MTKKEKEKLYSIIDYIVDSDGQIDGFERLYREVKEMIGYKYKD